MNSHKEGFIYVVTNIVSRNLVFLNFNQFNVDLYMSFFLINEMFLNFNYVDIKKFQLCFHSHC